MRTTPDQSADSLGNLGAPIRQATAKPAAAPVPIGNGVVRNADGTLQTDLPPPNPVWVYAPPADPMDEPIIFMGGVYE